MTMADGGAGVLLLHGQPGSGADWEQVRDAIGASADALAIDRPGWDRRSRASDLDGNAQAALAALDARGIGRATVVGHSFGGAVAAWIAVQHPHRVEALVLVAPSANVASLYQLDRWLAAPVAGELASAAALSAAGAALIAAPLQRRIARALAVDARYLRAAGMRLLAPAAWRAFVLEQRALIRDLPVLEAGLERISAPTVIVAGARDRVVPVSSLRQLATQIPGAELKLLARAGHLLPLRQPDALAEIILEAPHASSGLGSGLGSAGVGSVGLGSAGVGSGGLGSAGPGSGTTGVAGSSGCGTVAGCSGSAGVPGSGTAGEIGASGTAGVAGSVG